jgi:hypothetical protein
VEPLTLEVQDCAGANAGPLMEQAVLALAVHVTLVFAAAVNAAVWQSTVASPLNPAAVQTEPLRFDVQVGAAGVT